MAKGEATLLLKIKEMGAEAIDKVQESIGALKVFAVAAFAAISAVVYKSIDAYKEQEEATNKLSQAMANAGVFSEDLRKKYDDQAKALQKITTFADEQITSAQAILQAQIGNKEVTEGLTKATLNLAAAKKIDLASAAEMIGKTIGTTTNVLARQGIEFDNNTTGAARLAAVTEALNKKFHGQAEAAASGLGSLNQLQNAAGDVFEVLGEKLAPTITIVSRELIKLAEQFQKNEAVFDGFVSVVQFGLKLVNGLGSAFHDLSSAVGGYIGIVAGAGEAALKGQFGRAKMIVQQGLQDIQKMGEENEAAYIARNQAIDAIDSTRQQEKNATDLELLRQSNANKLAVKQEDQAIEDIALMEQKLIQMESENALIGANDEQQLAARIAHLSKMIAAEENQNKKLKLMRDKEALVKQQKEALIAKQEVDLANATMQAKVGILQGGANLAGALMGRESKAAFMLQQAAALAGIFVATKLAAAQAAATPPGPPYTAPLVAMVEAGGYLNMAAVAATTLKGLATGGIVSATQGGTPFILGEGGRDEAVIPLENGGVPGMGSTIIIQAGAFMGSASDAREFALMIDKELLELRRQNQSVSFDGIS